MSRSSESRKAAARSLANSEAILVWDWPLRVWHWTLALLVLIAWFTPNRHDRVHRFAGYAVIGLLLFRLVWGFIGTRHSRFRRLRSRLRAAPAFLRNVCRGRTGRYLGLNPAGVAMMASLLLMLCVSALTGAMQVTVQFFGVWWVEDTHVYASDAVLILILLHVAGVAVVSRIQRDNLTRAMITGRKRLSKRMNAAPS